MQQTTTAPIAHAHICSKSYTECKDSFGQAASKRRRSFIQSQVDRHAMGCSALNLCIINNPHPHPHYRVCTCLKVCSCSGQAAFRGTQAKTWGMCSKSTAGRKFAIRQAQLSNLAGQLVATKCPFQVARHDESPSILCTTSISMDFGMYWYRGLHKRRTIALQQSSQEVLHIETPFS